MTDAPDQQAIVFGFAEARGRTPDESIAEQLRHLGRSQRLDTAGLHALGGAIARAVEDRSDDELADAIAELHMDDLSLARQALAGTVDAIAEFERRFIDPLGPTIGRIDSRDSFVDEVRQRVRTKLLVADPGKAPKLDHYRGRGELATWVRVVAAREALTAARGDRVRATTDDDLIALEATTTGPELGAVKEQYREAFGNAFRAAIGELSAEQRNVLRLHYLHGMTVDDLGGLLKVHRSNAARRVASARSELLAGTRRRLLLSLQMGRNDFEDLMRLIASRIDVSIERHLGS